MDRKYPFADIAFVAAVFLDFLSVFLTAGNKVFWGITGVIAVAVASAVRLSDPVSMDAMLLDLDLSTAFLIIGALYSDLNSVSPSWLLPAGAGCLMVLISVMFMRTGGGFAVGKAVAFIMLALIAGISVLTLSFAAEPAGVAFVSFFELLGSFGKFVLNAFLRFMEWFGSLFPESDVDIGEIPGLTPEIEIPPEASDRGSFGAVLAVLLVLAIAVFLVYTLIKLLKGERPRYVKGERVRLKKKSKARLRGFFAKLLAALRRGIAMLAYMTKSNALAGYYRLVLRKSLTRKHRQKWETPREFLLRSGSDLDVSEVERLLYGSEETL